MPSSHAKCSASSAHRWINCPGSIALSEQCPEPGTSSFAEEGTLAHSLGELKLLRRSEGADRIRADPLYSAEMEEATDLYADMVEEQLAAAGPGAELLVEQRLDLSRWIPEGFGTSDAVVIGDGIIQVIDLKYGKGVRVEATGNPQLRLYALGAAELFEALYDFSRVRYTIIQPRLDHISTEEVSLADLEKWGDEVVVPAARKAMEGSEEFAAGEWCRFCPAKAICRARAEKELELLKMDFKDPPLLSKEEISEVLQKADSLKKWADDVAAYALAEAKAGEHFSGWKLVEGRSVRKYADDLKVAEKLKAAGYDEALVYERKLYSITAMEKIVGKKRLSEILGGLIQKPPGAPTLVPENDKRPAINPADDFKEDI